MSHLIKHNEKKSFTMKMNTEHEPDFIKSN